MKTFLQLCQMVARESGTISGVLPVSVTGQTGREAKVVAWTQEAWSRLQTARSAWQWMQGEFEGEIDTSAQRYTGASFGLDRWAKWVTLGNTMTIYQTALGVSDETPIGVIPFRDYRAIYERGARVPGRPICFSVSPTGELCFPLSDTAYTVRGEYRKSAQELVEGTDIPELPGDYHDLIAWNALELLAEHDEGEFQVVVNRGRQASLMSSLCRDQLPEVTIGGALA